MKKHVLFVGFLLIVCSVFAQNKTLGVGVATPNPNAALHVEAPAGNQGFILPRLTTAQRTNSTFVTALGAADNGLIVYDVDLQSIFIWDGSAWTSSAYSEFNGSGNGASFVVNNSANTNASIYASTNGTIGGTSILSAAILAETSTAFSAITAHVPSGQSNAISGITKSTDPGSWAGYFSAQTGTAVYASTASNVGGSVNPVAVYGESTGTGSSGAAFRTNNASNTYSTLYSYTNGLGSAGTFNIFNAANSNSTIFAASTGTGSAGNFNINNSSSGAAALLATTNGTGAAINGQNTGSGNGFSGNFRNTNASNTFPAIQASTAGTAPGVRVIQNASSLGGGMDVYIQNPSNNSLGFSVDHIGTGGGGSFNINNASNSSVALFAATNGTGGALSTVSTGTGRAAYFDFNNAASTSPGVTVVSNAGAGSRAFEAFNNGGGDAVYGQTNAAGGSGGNFAVNNASSTASALFATTNSSTGSSIGATNTANGNALTLFSGGVKVSVQTVTSSSIATRAAAYRITSGGTVFSFGFTTSDGEVFMVFNDTGSAITVEGVALAIGEGKTIIRFASGVFRGL